MKLIVFAPEGSRPGFMNNVNLIVSPGVGSATLDQALESSKKQVEGMGGRVSTSKVFFPAGEFGRFESHLKGPNAMPYVAVGYVHIHDGVASVVTFSCAEDQLTAFDVKAQKIMGSFKRK